MVNEVTVNKTLFTTTFKAPDGSGMITTTHDDVCEQLVEAGWQVISRTFKPGMKVIVFRRPRKVN